MKRYEPINGFFHKLNFAKRFIFGAFGICCLYTSVFAQPSSTDNAIPHRLDSLIGQHYYSQPDSFWQESYQLLNIAKAQKQWHYALDVLVRMAWCADYHKQMDTLRYFLQQAETLATTHAAQIDSLDADGMSRTDVTYTRGLYYYTMGDYQASIEAFKQIIFDANQQFLPVDSVLAYDVCSYIGQAYFQLSNYENAITYHRLARQRLPEHHATYEAPYGYDYYVALNRLYLGECYWVQAKYGDPASPDYAKAKAAFLQSLKTLQQYKDEITYKNAILSNYSLLAQVHTAQHQYDAALYYLQASLSLQADDDIERADTYMYFGNVYIADAKYKEAKKYYELSLAVIKAIYPDTHYRVAIRFYKLGEVYAKQQQWHEALTHYQQALSQLSEDFEVTNICENPPVTSGNPQGLLQILLLKGEAFNGLFEATGNPGHLQCALEAYQTGVAVIDEMRQVFSSQEYKQFMAARSLSLYEQAIATALKARHAVKDDNERNFIAKAFFFAEKSKSASLLEAVKNTAAQSYAGIPEELLAQENELKRELSYWENVQSRAQGETARQLNQKILTIQEQYDAFVHSLEQNYPEYYRLKYDKQVVPLAAVQKQLSEKTCLLSYFYGDSSIYVFSITQDSSNIHQFSITNDFEERLSNMLKMLNRYEAAQITETAYHKTFVENASQLYENLLAPLGKISKSVEKLIILPNGPLGYLPFEVLLTALPKTNEVRYDVLPYLLKKYQVSYEYSATLLFQKPAKEKQGTVSYIGFAPAYENIPLAQNDTYRSGFAPLQFNREEVQFAAELFGGATYLGEHATEKTFKKVAGNGKVLHLSMHALADDSNPMYAGFAFTPQPSLKEDNFLHTYELYNLSLNAELAVLSACETGTGQLSRGEGILSLGRAFKYAGCPTVAMSLWKVNDQTTGQIMQSFFKNLKNGLEKDEALRQAKLDYFATADRLTTYPHHWAPFVLTGNVSPLSINQNDQYAWLYLLLLPIALAVYWRIRKSW